MTLVDYPTISVSQPPAKDELAFMRDASHDESHLSQSHGAATKPGALAAFKEDANS